MPVGDGHDLEDAAGLRVEAAHGTALALGIGRRERPANEGRGVVGVPGEAGYRHGSCSTTATATAGPPCSPPMVLAARCHRGKEAVNRRLRTGVLGPRCWARRLDGTVAPRTPVGTPGKKPLDRLCGLC